MEEGKALTAERHDGGGISATAAKTDAFAVMMQSSRKERQRNTPAKRTATHMSQGVRTQLHSVADARVEMGAMGFRAEAVEHAVKLHAHGCGIDLEHAVASCIAFPKPTRRSRQTVLPKQRQKGCRCLEQARTREPILAIQENIAFGRAHHIKASLRRSRRVSRIMACIRLRKT